MKKLPKEYLLLKQLNTIIQAYFKSTRKTEISNLSEIYDYIRTKEPFKDEFPTSIDFSRFMRKMHQDKVLLQLIPNCSVDTSIHHHYKWKFYPQDTISSDNAPLPEKTLLDKGSEMGNIFSKNLQHEASNGVKVRSKQELYIYNRLLTFEFLRITYEKALIARCQERYPDFTIVNMKTKNVFYWEHLGMFESNNDYFDRTIEKLVWYRAISITSIEDGGHLILNSNTIQ